MLTQVCIKWLTAKMPFFTKMWLEKLYRKRLITSALRKDLVQIDGLYARISKLRYCKLPLIGPSAYKPPPPVIGPPTCKKIHPIISPSGY